MQPLVKLSSGQMVQQVMCAFPYDSIETICIELHFYCSSAANRK